MKRIFQISSLIIFLSSLLISLCDLFGVLPSFAEDKISYITLILLSVLGIYLVTEKSTKIESIENKIEVGFSDLLEHHHIPEVKRFNSLVDFYAYIVDQFKTVKVIYDTSWSNPQKFNNQEITKAEQKAYERFKNFKERLLKKGEVKYHEIFTFPYTSRMDRALKLIKDEYKSFNTVYYETFDLDIIPRFSFIILEYLDRKELLIFFYKNNLETHEERILIKSNDIVELFLDYYMNVFNNGKPLKLSETIFHENIADLKSQMT